MNRKYNDDELRRARIRGRIRRHGYTIALRERDRWARFPVSVSDDVETLFGRDITERWIHLDPKISLLPRITFLPAAARVIVMRIASSSTTRPWPRKQRETAGEIASSMLRHLFSRRRKPSDTCITLEYRYTSTFLHFVTFY